MSEIEEEKEADEKITELKEEIDSKMKKWGIQIRIERSMALDELAGADAVQKMRDALIKTIDDQKAGDIRVTFASLDWLFRYYAKMNRIFKTGIDEYLPDLK